MELLKIFNELEDLMEECPRVPLTKKLLIEEEELLKFLDKARNSLPEEVKQAQWVVDEREKVLNDAKEKVTKMYEQAEEEINRRIDENEIVVLARERAEQIIADAKVSKAQIINGSKKYAIDGFSVAEDTLTKVLEEIKICKEQLEESASQKSPEPTDEGGE